MILAIIAVTFIDLHDIINYYPRFWFEVFQYHLSHLFYIWYKLHWLAANQNLLFVFNISPMIWQKYKITENCNNKLWSRVYIRLGKSLENVWSGNSPVREVYIRESLTWRSVSRRTVLQSINFNNASKINAYVSITVLLCKGCLLKGAVHWSFRRTL